MSDPLLCCNSESATELYVTLSGLYGLTLETPRYLNLQFKKKYRTTLINLLRESQLKLFIFYLKISNHLPHGKKIMIIA